MQLTFHLPPLCTLRLPCIQLLRSNTHQFSRHCPPRLHIHTGCFALAQSEQRAHNDSDPTPASSEFFAKDSITFKHLGFHDKLCASLDSAGFKRPAYVQVFELYVSNTSHSFLFQVCPTAYLPRLTP
jgi:hypothetical protein